MSAQLDVSKPPLSRGEPPNSRWELPSSVAVDNAVDVAVDDWSDRAACRGRSRLFFADDELSQSIAVRVCARCSVRSECLDDARAIERTGLRFGVRGGLRAKDRGVSERHGW